MKISKGDNRSKKGEIKKTKRQPWNKGYSQIKFKVTPETNAKLDQIVKLTKMPQYKVIELLIMDGMRKERGLKDMIDEMVRQALAKEYARLAGSMDTLLSPSLRTKGKKESSN